MSRELLAGEKEVGKKVLAPYDGLVCRFLDEWSKALRSDSEAKTYSDVMTFAFWCRGANIKKMRDDFVRSEPGNRIGRGILFHIAPSNVPVNAGFTYVFGLLAGNTNVVRISTKRHPQTLCMCRVLDEVLNQEEYRDIREMTSFVTYDREDEITAACSECCAMRIIWGGDNTIQKIRSFPIPPRSTEITFADRYSFGILDGAYLESLDAVKWKNLIDGFYNDTYLMDQNACSTPHLVFWLNGNETIKQKFWQSVYGRASGYDLSDIKVSEKYTLLNEKAATCPEITNISRYENTLYVLDLDGDGMREDAASVYRGVYGMFFQTDITNLQKIVPFLDERVQTCAVAGVDSESVVQLVREHGCMGIDRIVPFGKTLDIGVYWDGYDLIRSMSRRISG